MTEIERDSAFAKVFATPEGKRLLTEVIGEEATIDLAEVRAAVKRMRARWGTGGDSIDHKRLT